MQDYGIEIFNIGVGLFILTFLMNIRSLQACRAECLKWIFAFGAFMSAYKHPPEIKKDGKNNFLNIIKLIWYYFECIFWFMLNILIWISIILIIIGSFLIII